MENVSNKRFDYQDEDEIDLLELFFILLNRWKYIVVTAFVTMLLFFGIYSGVATQYYSASIKMYVNADALSISNSISVSTLNASSSLVPIYGEILDTHLVLDKVGSKLASKGYKNLDYYNLTEMITSSALKDTPVFSITVKDTDPKRAIVIANTIADVLPDQIAGIIDGSSARIVDNALSSEAISRHVLRNTLIAGIVAGMFSAFIILMIDYFLNDTIRDPKLLDEFGDYPILGRVPDAQSAERKKGYSYYRSYKRYGSRENLTQDALLTELKKESRGKK